MGIAITEQELYCTEEFRVMRPLIFCNPREKMRENAISLNAHLAKSLISVKPHLRTMKIKSCFLSVLDTLPRSTVVKDFDVLFNPNYNIDVVRIIVDANKVIPFDVIWPGRYDNEKLIYADEGYSDYMEYDINMYDVTCVI